MMVKCPLQAYDGNINILIINLRWYLFSTQTYDGKLLLPNMFQ